VKKIFAQAGLALAATLVCTAAAPAPQFPVTPECTTMVRELSGPSGTLAAASGLRYVVSRQGVWNLHAHNVAIVQYLVCFSDGRKLDASTPASPFAFTLGEHQTIRGFEQAVQLAGTGGAIRARLPFWLAYGAKGRPPVIPPKSDLLFDIRVTGKVAAALSDRLLNGLHQGGVPGMQRAYEVAKAAHFRGLYTEAGDLDGLAYRLMKQHHTQWAMAVLRLNLQRFPNDKDAAQMLASAKKRG
jgi:hypothetical protein